MLKRQCPADSAAIDKSCCDCTGAGRPDNADRLKKLQQTDPKQASEARTATELTLAVDVV